MRKNILVFSILMCIAHPVWAAVDSYRFFHVTIDTPKFIFFFLLPFILAPFILMAVLAWRQSSKKRDRNPQ